MTIFGNYSRYYDLLYRDKNYIGEARFMHQLIQNHTLNAQLIFELGCGTGNHAVLLANEGYNIHGVDLSEGMLQKANERLSLLPPELASRLEFSQGDIRHIKLKKTFDVVISLFHVISYQTTYEDLLAAFTTVKKHLKLGGIFIFDVWYGPAVLSDHPKVRVKRLEDEEIEVTRVAEPVMYPNDNLVDVNYHVFIKDKLSKQIEELRETHTMRYLFKPEIELLLRQSSMKILDYGKWMSDQGANFDTWGVYFVAQNQ
jgi:SAM-dependent methyltransferase